MSMHPNNPYIDVVNDLLGGLEGPSIVVLRGPVGSGKALVLTRIVRDWVSRGRGKASIVSFMISESGVLSESRRHGMDLKPYVDQGRIFILEVPGYSHNPEERLAQLLSIISEASEEAGDGLVVFYPGDIGFGGLDANSLFSVMALLFQYMHDHGTKYLVAFTEPPPPSAETAKEFMEIAARYVFDLRVEVPEAGSPRSYLTIVKPLSLTINGSRTLEILYLPSQGLFFATYGILPEYDAIMDINDRVKTGIDWLDNITGGLIRGTSILLTGPTGSGKTILLLLLAYSMAGRGEKVLYISFEEPPGQLKETLKGLGLDYSIVKGNMALKNVNPRAVTLTSLFSEVARYMDNNYTVVILDGLHSLWKEYGNKYHRFLRDIIYYMKTRRRILIMAKILTMNEPVYTWLSSISDAIIELRLERNGLVYRRYICFRKMRMYPVHPACYQFDVKKGIVSG